MDPSKPWLDDYGDGPHQIDDPKGTMYEASAQTADRTPSAGAYDLFGTTATYRQFVAKIDRCADALAAEEAAWQGMA